MGLGLPSVAAVATGAKAATFAITGIFGVVLGALMVMVGWLLTRPKEERGVLRVKDGVVEHAGARVAKTSELTEGHAWKDRDGAHVQLTQKRRTETFRMRRIEDARAVLAATGLDASRRRARFRILAPSRTNRLARLALVLLSLPLSVALAVGLQHATGHVTSPALFLLPYIVSCLVMLIPGSITVGADGLLVKWLWQERFVPIADVECIRTESDFLNRKLLGVRLQVRGESEPIDVALTMPGRMQDSLEFGRRYVATVLERIEEARQVAKSASVHDAARALAREGRSGMDWLAALRESFGGAETFRAGAPLTADDLWRAVEDQSAEGWVRAAAAAALSSGLEDHGRARLRVAAEATAAPKLRVALEAAAKGDDAEIAGALHDVDEERGDDQLKTE
jgi:hypothetical protein